MNEFYHEFTVGFNGWYIILPLFMTLMFFVGTFKYVLDAEELKIKRRRQGDCLVKAVAMLLVIASFSLIMAESMTGIVQMIINHLGESSIAWFPVIAGGGLFASVIALYFLFVLFGKIGQWTMHGYLIDVLQEKKKEEEVEKAKAVRQYKQQLFDIIVEQLNGQVDVVDGEVTYRL